MNKYKLGLDAVSFSGMARLLGGRFSGVGVVLTLHHVRPSRSAAEFSPNRILEITPDFLDAAICELRDLHYDFVSLDEFHQRMIERNFTRKFIAFTLDDGYADNFTYAYPVFARHNVPFAIYVCSGIIDQSAHLWWHELEAIVQSNSSMEVRLKGEAELFSMAEARQKYQAFDRIYWQLRAMPHEAQLEAMEDLRVRYGSQATATRIDPLTWEDVEAMRASGLLTVGGHTVNHYALSKLSAQSLFEEIEYGCAAIRTHSGIEPRHFAYPFGDSGSAAEREFNAVRELGFATGVTTRKGVVVAAQARQLHAVPRISLNGDYQRLRYLRALMSGLPTGIYQRLKPQEATC